MEGNNGPLSPQLVKTFGCSYCFQLNALLSRKTLSATTVLPANFQIFRISTMLKNRQKTAFETTNQTKFFGCLFGYEYALNCVNKQTRRKLNFYCLIPRINTMEGDNGLLSPQLVKTFDCSYCFQLNALPPRKIFSATTVLPVNFQIFRISTILKKSLKNSF